MLIPSSPDEKKVIALFKREYERFSFMRLIEKRFPEFVLLNQDEDNVNRYINKIPIEDLQRASFQGIDVPIKKVEAEFFSTIGLRLTLTSVPFFIWDHNPEKKSFQYRIFTSFGIMHYRKYEMILQEG